MGFEEEQDDGVQRTRRKKMRRRVSEEGQRGVFSKMRGANSNYQIWSLLEDSGHFLA